MPDAEPEKGFFFRSDHFPFAKAGLPSLYIEHGRRFVGKPDCWCNEILSEYTALRYHAPSDEFSEDFVFDGAAQQATYVYLTTLDIANDSTWPNWHEGQEFKGSPCHRDPSSRSPGGGPAGLPAVLPGGRSF